MGGDEEEQWTYVAAKGSKTDKRSRGRRRGRNDRKSEASTSCTSRISSFSFYASSSAATEAKEGGQGGDNEVPAKLTQEQLSHMKGEFQQSIARIMEELDRHPYAIHLLQTLSDDYDKDDDTNKANKAYKEIICYGIGNFLPSSTALEGESLSLPRYPSAPMLQLALALVIRRHLAKHNSSNDLDDKNDGDNNATNMHSKHQDLVQMLFFEPLMTDLERTILNDVLHVDVIDTNERGKRQAASSDGRTLFYMPHCPMRLYSNVLWANWGEPLWNGSVAIYGNNFHGYDDRILGKEERTDPTNAVLRIMPHLVANLIDGLTSKANGGVESDLLVKMENAFNDCVAMTFDAKNGGGKAEGNGEDGGGFHPERPEEYVFDEEIADGEVI
jgi:hypothetical protein